MATSESGVTGGDARWIIGFPERHHVASTPEYEETPFEPLVSVINTCSDPTSDGQVSVLKCHPWIGMLTHTVLEDL